MAEPRIRFKTDNGDDYPEWRECILDEVFEERNEPHIITDDAPQLSFTIEQGVIFPEDKKSNKRDFLMKDKTNKKFLLTELDDIIYNPANLKFGAIHRNKLCRGVVSPIYAIFKTDQNPAFMEYVVRNSRFIKRSLKYLEGTVIKLMTLKPRDFVKMNVHIPCVEEQGKIADFLGDVDSLIEKSEQEIEKLRELKKGYLQKMFPKDGESVPEIRFPGFTDAWEQRKLGDLMEVTSVKRIHQSDWTDEGIRFLRARDIVAASKNEEITEPLFISVEKYNEYSTISGKVKIGDMLVTGVGSIGVPLLIKDEEPLYFKDGNIIWFKNENTIDGSFFYHSFTGTNIQKYIHESSGKGTVGTYTIDSGKKTPILLPKNREEQVKIGSFFDDLDNLITLHQRECDKYKELKKGLLQQMFV